MPLIMWKVPSGLLHSPTLFLPDQAHGSRSFESLTLSSSRGQGEGRCYSATVLSPLTLSSSALASCHHWVLEEGLEE